MSDAASAIRDKIANETAGFRRRYEAADDGIKRAAADLLHGAIDLHLHCDPSPQPRLMDAFLAAEQASAAGMRAIVLKDHITGMEDAAWLARDHADIAPPFEVFGSVWLNNQTAGWNAYAVDKAIVFGARLVGAPTLAAFGEFERAAGKGQHAAALMVDGIAPRPPQVIHTLDEDGAVRPEVLECIDRVVEADNVMLGTGHLSTREVWAFVQAAHERGAERICITHALMTADAPADEYRALCAQTGAVMEFVALQILSAGDGAADLLRAVGIENVTLSTDAGLLGSAPGVETYTWILTELLRGGLSEEEVVTMAHRNPAKLLALDAVGAAPANVPVGGSAD
jgi:hypothetical protein